MSWHGMYVRISLICTYIYHLLCICLVLFFSCPFLVGALRYLGEALLSLLRAVGLRAQGLDLMAKEPGSIAGDVAAEEAVQRAAEGCRASSLVGLTCLVKIIQWVDIQ